MTADSYDINEIKRRMQGALQALKTELSGLRTGRASAHLLDPVQVDAYGAHMPIVQVATVSVPEPRMISVSVWDKSLVHAVEKAITNANLGLNPQTEGQTIRLLSSAGDERWRETGVVPGRIGARDAVTVDLPARVLTEGEFALEVSPGGAQDRPESYHFRAMRR